MPRLLPLIALVEAATSLLVYLSSQTAIPQAAFIASSVILLSSSR